eukprot:2921052-Pyramimonas_sp.AAC.1
MGNEEHDREGRLITVEYEKFYMVFTYVPNAGVWARASLLSDGGCSVKACRWAQKDRLPHRAMEQGPQQLLE